MSRPKAPPAKPTPAAPVATTTRPLDRPVGRAGRIALAILVLTASYWLMADTYGRDVWPRGEGLVVQGFWFASDPFKSFRLSGDDFPLLTETRTRAALAAHLLEPLEHEIVPLFRCWTHLAAKLAGDLARLPAVLAWTSFAVLATVMLVGRNVVTREIGSRAVGFAAMACLGISTVMLPAATGASAARSLWAGLAALAMLAALQRWRTVDGVPWLLAAAVAALAAPLLSIGGLAAGLAGGAYLAVEPRRCHHKAALAPLLATGVALILVIASTMAAGGPVDARAWPAQILGGVLQTARTIPEALALNNLGLDTTLTPVQGAVLIAGFAAFWAWTRASLVPTPLEAAGAMLVVCGTLIALTVRGDSSSQAPLDPGGPHAIPQIGVVLFAAGWWTSVHRGGAPRAGTDDHDATSRGAACSSMPTATDREPLTRRSAIAIIGLTAALLVLHAPRAQRLFLRTVPPPSEAELRRFPIPALQRLRGMSVADDEAARQRRALARLDLVETTARGLRADRASIRAAFGAFTLPGWPSGGAGTKTEPLDLLDLPDSASPVDPDSLLPAIGPLMVPEPWPRPEWLPEDAPWPPVRAE